MVWILLDSHSGPKLHRQHPTQHARSGMTWFRMPLFVWPITPPACGDDSVVRPWWPSHCCLLASRARMFTWLLQSRARGDPILFQHLFWFYSHPAVYIMILPAMAWSARYSDICPTNPLLSVPSSRDPASPSAVIGSWFGLTTWFVTGASPPTAPLTFSFLSYLVAIPSAVKVFNWSFDAVQRLHLLGPADDLCARLIGLFVNRRHSRGYCPSRASVFRTSTFTTPTPRRSLHFHYLWLDARSSWVTWGACTSELA